MKNLFTLIFFLVFTLAGYSQQNLCVDPDMSSIDANGFPNYPNADEHEYEGAISWRTVYPGKIVHCGQSFNAQVNNSPAYAPYGWSASYPYFTVLGEDRNNIPGPATIVGQLIQGVKYREIAVALEYRLFDIQDPTNTSINVQGGRLWAVLLPGPGSQALTNAALFDISNPQLFETNGYGVIIGEWDLSTSVPVQDILNAWNPIAASDYVMSHGLQGGFSYEYVGIIYEHDALEGIMVTNVDVYDNCTQCDIPRTELEDGCFDTEWRTPVQMNYWGYDVIIRDPANGNAIVYQALNVTGQFVWDGVGNFGAYNGVPMPYGATYEVSIEYYGCDGRFVNDGYPKTFNLTREEGCEDPAFGGSKRDESLLTFKLCPNQLAPGDKVELVLEAAAAPSFVELVTTAGKSVQKVHFETQTTSINITVSGAVKPGIYLVKCCDRNGKLGYQKIVIQ